MELRQKFARQGLAREYEYTEIKYFYDLPIFLWREAKPAVKHVFKRLQGKKRQYFKFNIAINVTMEKLEASPASEELITTEVEPWFHSKNGVCLPKHCQLDESIDDCMHQIMQAYESWQSNGSGFNIVRINAMRLLVARFHPLTGAGRETRSRLPNYIIRKGAICRLENLSAEEQKCGECFIHCIRAAYGIQMKQPDHRRKEFNIDMQKMPGSNTFDCRGLSFPTPLAQIRLFEQRNPELNINVYGPNLAYMKNRKRSITEPLLHVYYHSKKKEDGKILIDLIMWKKHYYLVRDLSRLLGSRHRCARACRSCLTVYSSEVTLQSHKTFCDDTGTIYRFPKKNEKNIRFKKFESTVGKTFAIYYDSEVILKPTGPRKKRTKRKILRAHVIVAISAIRICTSNPKFNSDLFMAIGPSCLTEFFAWLDQMVTEIELIYMLNNLPVEMTAKDWDDFFNQEKCTMCQRQFTPETQKLVDHDHISSKFRGAKCLGSIRY